jgi:hypothetical protein
MTAPTIVANVITVDGWSCYDYQDPPPDDDGNIWVWQEVTGWFGGLDPRGAPVARPLVDGDYDGIAPFSGRTVTITGALVATSRGGLQRGLDRIAGVLAGATRRGVLVVDEQHVPVVRSASVRLGGATMATREGPTHAKWSLVLYAADPTRYGVDAHSATLAPFTPGAGRTYNLAPPRVYGGLGTDGRTTVTNRGNANTPLTVTFYGPSKNPTLQLIGGARLQLLMTLGDGEWVTIDSAQRSVLYNGSASRRQFLSGDSRWIYLPPGPSDLFYTVAVNSGVGQCVATWRDGWS